jgi:DNA-binding ferritin-like protein
MERIEELCCLYICHLQSIGLIHRAAHWAYRGREFYGAHLMLDRIYESAFKDADLAAEKFVGLFGTDCIDLQSQAQVLSRLLEKATEDNLIERSLSAEKRFLAYSEKLYGVLEDAGKMTLGLDDMVMAIASKREEACYLLQQSLPEQKDDNMSSKMAARKTFLKRIAQTADPMEQEKHALAQLKMQISSVLATLSKGHTNFQVQMRRETGGVNAGTTKYNLSVVLPDNTPEASARDALEKALPQIVSRVPFFAGKVNQARVVLLQ